MISRTNIITKREYMLKKLLFSEWNLVKDVESYHLDRSLSKLHPNIG